MASIVVLTSTESGANSLIDINANFATLNSLKLESAAVTTIANAAAAAATPKATSLVTGITALSLDPAVTNTPIAAGTNDPRIPTQNENDALVGTSGTVVSSSNKLVDNADTATVATANKVVRALGSGLIDPTFYLNPSAPTFTAGANITAGQALAIGYQQSDGGVLIDTSGTVNGTQTVTVGVHTNRGLMVFLNSAGANIGTITSVLYNGVAMTLVDSIAWSDINGHAQVSNSYYLAAPATGANTLTVNATGNTPVGSFVSLYNAAQTQPEAHTDGNKTNTQTLTLNTVANGAMVFTAGYLISTSGSFTNFTGTAGFANANSVYNSGQVFPAATTITAIIGATGTIGTLMMSIAPITAPAIGVYPASSATSTISQFQNTYDTFAGFANATVSAGASVGVTVGGVQTTGISGLTAAKQYYLNDTPGTIGISPGTHSRKVGISTSTTSLLITNIW